MEKKTIILGVVAVIALGGGFFGGTAYEKNSLQTQGLLRSGSAQMRGAGAAGAPAGAGARAGGGRGGMSGGFATGQILSKDDTSITVQSPDGGSKVIYISGTTMVRKSDRAVAGDLATGERVMVNGKSNPDGTVAADSVEILPAMPAPAGNSNSNGSQN